MRSEKWKTIGILGGMGAAAGAELAGRLAIASDARTDAEQIPCLLYTNPCIPDRTECLLQGGPSPLDAMTRSLEILTEAGAELLCIPCNTAHAWYEDLIERIDVPIINMLKVMAQSHSGESGTSVGVLCTSGLARTGLYQECCREHGLQALLPSEEEMDTCIMPAIYGDEETGLLGLKGGNTSERIVSLLWKAGQRLVDRGASALWLACTEISLVKEPLRRISPIPVADAMDQLVAELIRRARR